MNIILPICVIVALLIMTSFATKIEISELERRKLTTWKPLTLKSWMSGDFTKNVEDYLADHISFRSNFIEVSDKIKQCSDLKIFQTPEMSKAGKMVKVIKKSADLNTTYQSSFNDKPNSSELLLDSNQELVSTQGIYIYDSCAYQFFGGTKKSASRYAKALNNLRIQLNDSIVMYSILVPSATEFYLPKQHYKGRSNSEESNITYLFSQLDPSILKTNIYRRLASHNREYLYYKTDHHWTARAAYYGYLEFSSAAGFEPLGIEKMPPKFMKSHFLGSLYALTRDNSLQGNPDKVEYFDIDFHGASAYYKMKTSDNWRKTKILNKRAEFGLGYGVFLGIDYPIMRIEGGSKNKRILFILKDSYANAFVPFLVPHFERIFVADIRYFPYKLLEFIKSNQVNEVLVMNHLVTANSPFSSNKINTLIK